MSGLKISEVFCEILSGFAIIVCLIPFFDIIQTSCISQSLSTISKHLSATSIGAVIIISYLLGIIMDAVGMVADDYIMEPLLLRGCNTPTESESNEFWKNVPAHVLSYRDSQWAYYSTYRNLSIILIIPGFLWIWSILNNYGWYWAIAMILVFAFIEFALIKTIKVLLIIYLKISRIQYTVAPKFLQCPFSITQDPSPDEDP